MDRDFTAETQRRRDRREEIKNFPIVSLRLCSAMSENRAF
jgi:hypothetical protein